MAKLLLSSYRRSLGVPELSGSPTRTRVARDQLGVSSNRHLVIFLIDRAYPMDQNSQRQINGRRTCLNLIICKLRFSSSTWVPLATTCLTQDTRGLVGGLFKSPANKKTFPVYEPSSEQVLGHCSDFGHQDFVDTINVAEDGFRSFSTSTTAKERGALLRRWHDLILGHVDDCKDYKNVKPNDTNAKL